MIRTDPLGDTAVAPGSSVTMYVSSGKAGLVAPNVVGKNGAEAASSLTTLGFVVTTNEQPLPAGDANNGLVLAQSVPAGTSVVPGSPITITVGRADTATTVAP